MNLTELAKIFDSLTNSYTQNVRKTSDVIKKVTNEDISKYIKFGEELIGIERMIMYVNTNISKGELKEKDLSVQLQQTVAGKTKISKDKIIQELNEVRNYLNSHYTLVLHLEESLKTLREQIDSHIYHGKH